MTDKEPLHDPAGVPEPDVEGIITVRTKRRQEQLDRLKADPGDPGFEPPGEGDVDNRNRAAEREQRELIEHNRAADGSHRQRRTWLDRLTPPRGASNREPQIANRES
jgi:hypothetical protein